MKELSLNILDITQNSITAAAKNIGISLIIDEAGQLTLTITDDGCGMKPETVASVTDPFTTGRTTRKVGLGLPFLKLAAEQTGGSISVTSRHIDEYPLDHGTTVVAVFDTKHIDFTPIGDMVQTLTLLIGGSPDIDFTFTDIAPDHEVSLDTKELRSVLGDDVSLGEYEVLAWIKDYLSQQYQNCLQ